MSDWRNCIKHYRASSWLLVAILFVQIVFPLHFHMHHDDKANSQEHVHIIDSHLITDQQEPGHHADENAHTLKTSPDVIAKQSADTSFVIILTVGLMSLFSLVLPLLVHHWRRAQNFVPYSLYYRLAPPLRAPPSI